MRILHVASFSGNIGDEANHLGFRNNFNKYIDKKAIFEEVEIRKFYKSWNELKFDDSFVEKANEYDLVVFGGGNFFELCWDYSSTGTTIDLSKEILDKLQTKVLFNGIGVDDGKGVNPENINKFKAFLDYVLNDDKFLFSVRNDGSLMIMNRYFKECNLNKVIKIPDGAFSLVLDDKRKYNEIDSDKINIGINIAGDMLKTRFKDKNIYEKFISEFSEMINTILKEKEEINIVFLPHMYADLNIISQIIDRLDDKFRRFRICVAPLLNGQLNGGEYIFGLYKQCDLILGMRFHSNVCAIAQNIPSIGIVTYHKHKYLFDEINLPDRYVEVNETLLEKEFWTKFKEEIQDSIGNKSEIAEKYKIVNDALRSDTEEYFKVCKEWIFNK